MPILRIARSLGWLGVGLGAAQLLAGRRMAGALGMTGRAGALRASGARGLLNGLAILANPGSAALLWTRVGGDAMDLALLAGTPSYGPRQRANARIALAAVAGIALLDLLCAAQLGRRDERGLPRLFG